MSCSVDDALTASIRYASNYIVKPQKKVLVLGSGGLTIGQAGEFDYSGAQVGALFNVLACFSLVISVDFRHLKR